MASAEVSNPYLPLLRSSSSAIFLLGAGISTSIGIPDFRSKDGLYASLKLEEYGLNAPEDLFDYEHFCASPAGFFKWSLDSLTLQTTGSKFHRFLSTLKNLHRIYTQNIDGLESSSGVPDSKIVHCHGSLQNSTCQTCNHKCPTPSFTGEVPLCPVPTSPLVVGPRTSSRGKKKQKLTCEGILKPDITFFGEPLQSVVSKTIGKDRLKSDLITVVGTSLKVEPFSKIVNCFEGKKVLVNRDYVGFPGEGRWDCVFLCDSDEVVEEEGTTWREVVKGVFLGRGGVWCEERYQKLLSKKKEKGQGQGQGQGAEPVVVETVTCDACMTKTGKPFYTCEICEGFDLCEGCVGKEEGGKRHRVEEGEDHRFRFCA
ncbi:hypothetical protein TrVE_jg2223 [Triparma verrucosa]|uniref:Deacetylase sirtuin-type domain-containing protein n=1 Tax=Triparma verrucosa TaxID=1606542 RepID=A0A9W7BAH0_9STRA|nr:hypothetical protein TrVE_jg2223 [Triparma verrucosa]